MFSGINWIVSIVIFFLVVSLFNFRITGWILGIILSFIYKEFVGPLLIIKSGDKIINTNELKSNSNPSTIFSELTKNFNFVDNRDSNYCIYFYHIKNDRLIYANIKFKVYLVQYKNEPFKLSLIMVYDLNKKGRIIDIIFNGKSILVYDIAAGLNFFANENYNAESSFSMITKREHRNDLNTDFGKLQILFENGIESISSDEIIFKSFVETFLLGIYYNNNYKL